jgi:hypothetical protein
LASDLADKAGLSPSSDSFRIGSIGQRGLQTNR